MTRFVGLGDAKRGFNSNRLGPGEYYVRLDSSTYYPTETRGNMWKNTLTILGVVAGDHHVGEEVNTFFREAAGRKTFLGNLKGFIAGVLGCNDEDVDDGAGDRVLDEDLLKGTVFYIKAVQRVTKKTDEKTGEPITYMLYTWGKFMTGDEIRAAIGDEAVAQFFPAGLA